MGAKVEEAVGGRPIICMPFSISKLHQRRYQGGRPVGFALSFVLVGFLYGIFRNLNPFRRGIAILNSRRPRSEEFRSSAVVEPAGGIPPININECFLRGPMNWGWFWLGPWTFRFSGGFFLSYRWFALGVDFGRYLWRRLRFILSLVRVRGGFGRYPN